MREIVPRRWTKVSLTLLTVSPLKNSKGAIVGASTIGADESRRAREQQHLLLREMHHGGVLNLSARPVNTPRNWRSCCWRRAATCLVRTVSDGAPQTCLFDRSTGVTRRLNC
jgi:hypothetical protein